MALARWVVTATVTLPPGAFTADDIQGTAGTVTGTGAPANFGTGSYAQGASEYGAGHGTAGGGYGTPTSLAEGLTFIKGQVIWADSSGSGGAGALYTAIGAGNLRAYVDGQDTVGHAALSN